MCAEGALGIGLAEREGRVAVRRVGGARSAAFVASGARLRRGTVLLAVDGDPTRDLESATEQSRSTSRWRRRSAGAMICAHARRSEGHAPRGPPWSSRGSPWGPKGSLGNPKGPWGTLGLPKGPFGVSQGSLGVPKGPHGAPWGPKGPLGGPKGALGGPKGPLRGPQVAQGGPRAPWGPCWGVPSRADDTGHWIPKA